MESCKYCKYPENTKQACSCNRNYCWNYGMTCVPRRIPAGTSYNPQTGSNASINAILWQAAAHTAESEENNPVNCVLKTVIGTVIKALSKMENREHFIKICTQCFVCPAAQFWLTNVVAVWEKAVVM